MAIYSLAVTSTPAASTALWELRTTSTDQVKLYEIGISNGADITPSSAQYGIGTPAARGVTPTSPITFLAEDTSAPAATLVAATAWTTSPTVPANFLRIQRFFHFMDVQWTFPRGFGIAVSASFVIWPITVGTATAQQVYAVEEE